MKKIYFLLFIITAIIATATAQVGIGTTTPNASAALDISSDSKGLLVPQMTDAQRNAIPNPATGLLVLQTNGLTGFYYNAGTPGVPNWINLSAYKLQQNINTNGRWISPDGSNNGVFINSNGTGIGTNAPDRPLAIKASGADLLSFLNSVGSTRWHVSIPDFTDLNFGETGTADGRLYLKTGGNVGIGTTNPNARLDVNGDIKYSGNLFMDVKYIPTSVNLLPSTQAVFDIACPVGYKVIGGGGGYKEPPIALDLTTNYSGPAPGTEATAWRLVILNTSSTPRTVTGYAICAKVQ